MDTSVCIINLNYNEKRIEERVRGDLGKPLNKQTRHQLNSINIHITLTCHNKLRVLNMSLLI